MTRKIALVLLLWSSHAAYAQNVTDEVDRFTGARTVKYSSSAKISLGVPHLSAVATTKDGVASSSVGFIVGSFRGRNDATAWKYLRCHQVAWLVDGQPMPTEATRHDGQVQRHGVTEIIIQPLTLDQMQLIGAASRVEYRICNDEFVLSAEEVSGIGRVAAVMRGEAPATGGPESAPAAQMKYRPKVP